MLLCVDGRDPVSDFRILERELYLYDPALIKKPAIIFANKIDHTPHKAKQVQHTHTKTNMYLIYLCVYTLLYALSVCLPVLCVLCVCFVCVALCGLLLFFMCVCFLVCLCLCLCVCVCVVLLLL